MDDTLLFPAHLVPKTQALSCSTFRLPPLDGTVHPAEFPDWHLAHSPDHPLFVYERPSGGVQILRWADAAQAVLHATQRLRTLLGWTPGRARSEKAPVVGIFASVDAITYWTVASGVIRAGYAVFLLSARSSPVDLAHFVRALGVKHLLISGDAATRTLVAAAINLLQGEDPVLAKHVTRHPIPLFENLYWQPRLEPSDIPYERQGGDAAIVYLHSSGSTGLPKPVPWSNRRWLQTAAYTFYGDTDLTGTVHSIHASPMFHTLGYAVTTFACAVGLTLGTFAPQFPPQVWSADAHFAAAVATAADSVISSPTVFEEWAKRKECVAWLATIGFAVYGGAPLDEQAGVLLASQGVNLQPAYGATELAGAVHRPFWSRGSRDPLEYEWIEFAGNVLAEFVPQGDGTFECVILSHALSEPAVVNCEIRGVPAFATADLFQPHPEKPGLWRYLCRKDTWIVHSTGYKTNPILLEAAINKDSHIRDCVVFGRGRPCPGILIDPHPEHAHLQLQALRDLIWAVVERANAAAHTPSRIVKEMIITVAPDRPFAYTAKGTLRRQTVIHEYERDIEQVYRQCRRG